jgi:hypothetical protein
VLTAPSFLSGLTAAELGGVKQLVETRVNPKVAAAKQATTKALGEAEAGWQSAIGQISDLPAWEGPTMELRSEPHPDAV